MWALNVGTLTLGRADGFCQDLGRDFVQTKGFASALWFSRYLMIALLSSAMPLKAPRRMQFGAIP